MDGSIRLECGRGENFKIIIIIHVHKHIYIYIYKCEYVYMYIDEHIDAYLYLKFICINI